MEHQQQSTYRMLSKQKAKEQKEIEKQLKKQLKEEYEKEKLECSICKRMIQRKCLDAHQKTARCQKTELLLDKPSTKYYYEKNDIPDNQKTFYDSVKCEYCSTYAKTCDEVNEKFGFKKNGEIYKRCKTCMNNICLWKDEHKDKQTEYDTKHYENNKENIIKQQCEKTTCNVCNSLVMKCNLKRHQETDICKKKALSLNMSEEDKKTQQKDKQHEYYKRYYDTNRHKVIAQQCEKIQCNLCNSLIMRCNLNRHQETEICKKKSLLNKTNK